MVRLHPRTPVLTKGEGEMNLEDILEWFHDHNYEITEVHRDASDGSYTITLNGVFEKESDADDADEN